MATTNLRGPSEQGWQQTQPTSQKLSLRALLELPFRICNPPPAVRKSRSCGVTPVYQIKLDDVLDRKHLPPLGLKDFEEFLLFVEECPEYLYFTLWLREYTKRYTEWMAQRPRRPSIKPSSEAYRVQNPAPADTNRPMALFYAKAQRRFFAPGADYRLDAPDDVLAPFVANLADDGTAVGLGPYGAHPDPTVFTELDLIARQRLKQSLDRFVTASYQNVGNARAWCGFVGGTAMLLAGTVAPVTLNFVRKSTRWERLAALPGMWLGLTVIIASLHGVCLMIYVFGDLRQLRRFEMTRPAADVLIEKRPESPPVPLAPLATHPPPFTFPNPVASHAPAPRHSRAPSPLEFTPLSHQPFASSLRSLEDLMPPDSPHSQAYSSTPLRSSPFHTTKQVRIKSPSPSPVDRADSVDSLQDAGRMHTVTPPPGPNQPSPGSSTYSADSGVDVYYDEDGNPVEGSAVIEISAAMYDEMPDESEYHDGAPRPYSPVQVVVGPEQLRILDELPASEQDAYLARTRRLSTASSATPPMPTSQDRWRTASFIPAYSYLGPPKGDPESGGHVAFEAAEEHGVFDFEGLPPRKPRAVVDVREAVDPSAPVVTRNPPFYGPSGPVSPRSHFSPNSSHGHLPAPAVARTRQHSRWSAQALVSDLQERCSKAREPKAWDSDTTVTSPTRRTRDRSLAIFPPEKHAAHQAPKGTPSTRRRRLREIFSVPAFRSPLTRVLSPVVTRAQWEIVVRSGLIASVISLAACGILLAIPVY